MTDRAWQIEFVRQLAQTIADRMVADIEGGRIPEDWEGLFLRELFADRAGQQTFKMERKQRSRYNNDVLVEGL